MGEYSDFSETIAAVSTPPGAGGIGVIRISGPQAAKIAERVFCSARGKSLQELAGYSALFGRVYDAQGEFDEAVALNFRAPASYTGEDVVELSCHGGMYVTQRLLRAVFAAGAVPAGPGEFTRRAFLNGKIGLTEAESVMQIICAEGQQAEKAALAGHDGALEKRILRLKDSLTAAAAHLDAWADYPEDDIPQVTAEGLTQTLSEAKKEISILLDQFEAGRILREGVVTVIAGKPNVGKSTLMNLLSGCERSIVTQYAGTTRDVVEESVLLGGIPLRLADTAGIHSTQDPVESIGVGRALERVRSAQLVLAVFDSSRELDEDDRKLAESLSDVRCIAVINKSDLPPKIDEAYIQSKFRHIVTISASSAAGLEELTKTVADVLGTSRLDPSTGILFTERQRRAAEKADSRIEEALEAVRAGVTLDAVTVLVEDAVGALLELTGERVSESVVDRVFHDFCVGK